MYYDFFDSTIGRLMIAIDDSGLRHIDFENSRYATSIQPDWMRAPQKLKNVRAQLRDYFAGHLQQFNLTLNPQGTEFQLKVWNELKNIPYGATISYQELASRVGNIKACRAVGAANGRNPLPIIIPCHRVIGNDGSLTGFGGGLPIKRRLLELEQVRIGQAPFQLTA